MKEEITINSEEQEDLYEHYKIKVEKGQSLLRIDKYLRSRIQNISRTRIQAAADARNILVNGNPVKSNYKVKPNDEISVVLSFPPKETIILPENIPLEILYEDDDIIVINKQAGIVVHPGCGNYNGTLLNALAWHFGKEGKFSESDFRFGLVHRLDKGTSGVMVVAKNEVAQAKLAGYFFNRNIERTYTALVWGDFDEDSGTVTGNIGRNLKNRKIMDVFPIGSEYGKPAITHYKVLERFRYVTLLECKLETGRTHQIRVHMKSIGKPIFCDAEYGGDKILKGVNTSAYKNFVENNFQILNRPALHATTLGFIHPTSGKEIFFKTDLPTDFKTVLENWRKYFE